MSNLYYLIILVGIGYFLITLSSNGTNDTECKIECGEWSVCTNGNQTRQCMDCNGVQTMEQRHCFIVNDEKVGYVVISHQTFFDEIQPLVELRKQQYEIAEYYLDNPTPTDIYQIINQNQEARFVFLVGDSTLLPTQYYEETPTDNKYVDLDNNEYPDLAIGRLPLTNPEDVMYYVDKVLEYEQNFPTEIEAVYVASSEPIPADKAWKTCTAYKERIYPYVQFDGYEICCYCNNSEIGCEGNRQAMIDYVNNKHIQYVFYKGHGGETGWMMSCNYLGYMRPMDIDSFFNKGNYPIVITMSCSTATLEDKYSIPTLGLAKKDAGFVAFLGSTVNTGGYEEWDISLAQNLNTKNTIGEAILATKKAMQEPQLVYQQQILGDPALTINRQEISLMSTTPIVSIPNTNIQIPNFGQIIAGDKTSPIFGWLVFVVGIWAVVMMILVGPEVIFRW